MHKRLEEIIQRKYSAKPEEKELILGEAKKQLALRKDELIKALSKRVSFKKYTDFSGKFSIILPNRERLASFEYTIMGTDLHIFSLRVLNKNPKENSFRHLGIGKLLLKVAINFAIKNNLDSVMLDSEPRNYGFYEKLGFKKMFTFVKGTKDEYSEFEYEL